MLGPGRAEAVPSPPPQPPPVETIHLTNGSVLVGHVVSRSDGKVHVLVDGVGEVIVDSTAVAPATPPAAHR